MIKLVINQSIDRRQEDKEGYTLVDSCQCFGSCVGWSAQNYALYLEGEKREGRREGRRKRRRMRGNKAR